MGRQIRLDDETYRLLAEISKRAAQPKAVCASLILETFHQLIESMDSKSQIFIESGDDRTKFALPFRPERFKDRNVDVDETRHDPSDIGNSYQI